MLYFYNLPVEIQENIILQTDDPLFAIMFSFVHVTKLLLTTQNTSFLLQQLIEYKCSKQLYWIHVNNILSNVEILSAIISLSDLSYLQYIENLIPIPHQFDALNSLFQVSLSTCILNKIEHILNKGFIPSTLSNIRNLRFCKDTLLRLATILPANLIMTSEVAVIAMESDNVEYLKMADKFFDVRNSVSHRDLLISARKGALECLKWYHLVCHCNRHNYCRCVFDESIYRASLQSHNGEIVQWLENETNCAMKKLGYTRKGYLEFGYGDIVPGGRGLIWFR